MTVIFMNDEPVAVTMQTSRKSEKEIEFISKAAAIKIRDFILSLYKPPENDFPIVNLDEEIPLYNKIDCVDSLLYNTGIYNNKLVKINKIKTGQYQWDNKNVKIVYEDGRSEKVRLNKILFPLPLLPEGE